MFDYGFWRKRNHKVASSGIILDHFRKPSILFEHLGKPLPQLLLYLFIFIPYLNFLIAHSAYSLHSKLSSSVMLVTLTDTRSYRIYINPNGPFILFACTKCYILFAKKGLTGKVTIHL